MDDKKKRMIEESMKLFSEKGFHSTSIQEIADKSDVSKGAFYLHFQSKDELMIEIYKYYSEVILEKMGSINSSSQNPLEQFTEQIAAFLGLFKEHKEYLMMHVRDNINLGDKMNELIFSLHKQSYDWIESQITLIYGEKVQPYIVDIVIQIDGMLSGYFKWIAIHDLKFNNKELANYITSKVDVIVQSILHEHKQSIFQYQDLSMFKEPNAQEIIQQIKKQIERSDKPELIEAIHVLEEEWNKQEPKKIIIQSMLEHLEANATIKESIRTLKKYL
ncbi:TetR/AcrR family transcriptional regulator [Gracilibacillus massiliensis]|uniref:TetR/AcrR family transcriptional regulator n=1 Tax=Gracilibacillus massiliensis TaxID=1564956 RepID=UPI00071E5A65|nr:TetR/AcrR family transcriptional regulator [Gracilibacillus massiliensis]